ncbi:MAG: histidine kinase [Acidimicrobiaceae bacterium]|nr:histidine kinase [Acidimicrobiaceae bacterium]
MRWLRRSDALRRPGFARHVRRVALGAALLAVAAEILVCVIIDLNVRSNAQAVLDSRVRDGLSEMALSAPEVVPLGTDEATGLVKVGDRDDDLDDSPILAWWIPSGARVAVPLTTGDPRLPRSDWGIRSLVSRTVAGDPLRFDGVARRGGVVVVATSTRSTDRQLGTLLLAEGIFTPVLFLGVFAAALLVGRGAAGPVADAHRRQREFAADASHELRTPLGVIEAEVGLALSEPRDAPAYHDALERVGKESRRLGVIVDELLFLARLDAGVGSLPSEPVDLGAIAEACTARFAPVAARQDQRLEYRPGSGSPLLVAAPPEWMDRVLGVLLDNACRYAGASGTVEVSSERRGSHALLTVDDSGPGIPDALRAVIFERFRRGTDTAAGSGLGLAIADTLVSATNGSFEVGRSPLGGARMRVAWPLLHPHRGG